VTAALFRAVLAVGALCGSVAAMPGDADGFVIVRPADLDWQGVPGIPGVQAAKVLGDPSGPGPYVMRARFSPGVMTRPHRHSSDRYVVVISGTWYVGTGEEFDPLNTQPLPAGSFMLHPAGAVHFDGARDEPVEVQISGIGPVTTEWLSAPPGTD
jgi:quercetin dioxygenase-like cupin family protein